jgi:hypothetical protein
MTEFDVNLYERIGYKAAKKGWFVEWQQLSSSIKDEEEILLCEAGVKAYKQLKLQGSV